MPRLRTRVHGAADAGSASLIDPKVGRAPIWCAMRWSMLAGLLLLGATACTPEVLVFLPGEDDAGPVEAGGGAPLDAGVWPDANVPTDAGVWPDDAPPPDTGADDAGVHADAKVDQDSGPTPTPAQVGHRTLRPYRFGGRPARAVVGQQRLHDVDGGDAAPLPGRLRPARGRAE